MARIILLIISMVSSLALSAAVAPAAGAQRHSGRPETLPDAPNLRKGVLGNGLTYYIITDNSDAGMADFILVQKPFGPSVNPDGRHGSAFATGLYSFPGNLGPAFLARAGAPVGTSSFFAEDRDACIYRITDMPVTGMAEADSAILMLVNIASRDEALPLSRQALIVSGDVDPDRVEEHVSLLSMHEPLRKTDDSRKTGGSAGRGARQQEVSGTVRIEDSGNCSVVTVSYPLRPLPEKLRNTVIVPISGRMNLYISEAIGRRLSIAAESCGLNLLWHSVSVRESGPGSVLGIGLGLASSDTCIVKDMLKAVMETVESEGFSMEEYRMADRAFSGGTLGVSARNLRKELADRAVRNFMYGTSLASSVQERDYLLARPLSDTLGLDYLNRYASAIFKSGCARRDSLPEALAVMNDPFTADTALLPAVPQRISARLVRTEHLTGASVLPFSNGLKVYYKEDPEAEAVSFSVFYKGGYSEDTGIAPGAGAFYSDIMKLDSVSGMDYRRFERLLECYGITLECDFALNHLTVSGKCPVTSLDVLWRGLNAFINERTADSAAFADYVARERMLLQCGAGSECREIADTMDFLLHPFSGLSSRKRFSSLESLDYGSIRDFISEKLGRTGNAVFAFVSPLSVEGFKDVCRENAGWFEKKKAVRNRNHRDNLNVLTGQVTSKLSFGSRGADAEGGGNVMLRYDAVYAVPCEYDSRDFYTARIAAVIMKTVMDESLAAYGTSSRSGLRFGLPPDRCCYLSFSVVLPDDVNVSEVAFDMATAMKKASCFSDSSFERAKRIVLNEARSHYSEPGSWMNLIRERYVFNKNVFSGYEERISGIAPEDVADFIRKSLAGGCVEVFSEIPLKNCE